jgi:hypothetical protein
MIIIPASLVGSIYLNWKSEAEIIRVKERINELGLTVDDLFEHQ